MGNMLPCLVQGSSSSILPPMNTKHWSRSMKILARTLRRSTKLPHGSNRVKAAAGSTETSSAAYRDIPRARRAPRSGQNRRRAAVRVKVVLTRAEAARLLSLTAHGHRTAAQVVGELKRMQAAATGSSRAFTAQVISELKRMEELVVARASTSPSASTAWRPVLESIPEEWQ
ncbi:hypothetical protein SETIT_3G075800v2 [Setaria italica]|uniref:Uncharacterized protein n=2 Tax=Setaria italica TaxID=4555 RepID=A0A368QEH7_SETIT|nr:uncharacterized protein LOC111256605 [Setaria italica]RCV15670.1 hypothetical protein SETIT_3G075800v2 [Setaria italica]